MILFVQIIFLSSGGDFALPYLLTSDGELISSVDKLGQNGSVDHNSCMFSVSWARTSSVTATTVSARPYIVSRFSLLFALSSFVVF